MLPCEQKYMLQSGHFLPELFWCTMSGFICLGIFLLFMLVGDESTRLYLTWEDVINPSVLESNSIKYDP